MKEYYTNAFYINKHFINLVSRKCIRITCKITKANKNPTSKDLISEISATLGGVYADDYDPMKKEFSLYIFGSILTKEIKRYES